MPQWPLYVGITVAFVMIYLLFGKFKKDFIKMMSTLLYANNDADTYLQKLNSFEGKLYLNKNTRLFRMIDGYALKNDKESIKNTFKQLENLKLTFGQKVSLYEKEVSFYIENKEFEEAIKANQQIQELNKQVEIDDLNKIAVNAQAQIDIYVNRDGSLAEEMVKAGDESTITTVKGSYYYRAAKCYYLKGDKKNTDKYLKKAYTNLAQTSWAKFIDTCLDDHSHLEER